MSRRQWLARLGGLLPERSSLEAERGMDDGPPPAGEPPRACRIGRLYDFPPGSERRVNDGQQLLRSLPEGLQAMDVHPPEGSGGRVRPLRLERDGTLWLLPDEEWPVWMVLSTMTGTPQRLEED